jgi:hypothetical protein
LWRGGLELRNVLNINKEFSGKLRSKKVLKTLCKTNVLGRFVGTFGTSPPPPVANIFRKNFRFPEEGPKFLNSPLPPPQPDSVRYGPVRQFSTCYVQTISDLLEQLVDSLLASSAHQPCYMQSMMTTCSRLVNNWEQVMRTHLVDKL